MGLLLALVVGRALTSRQLVAEARSRMDGAKTITMSVVHLDNGSKIPRDPTRFWYRKDGYLRWENPSVLSIMTPAKSWLIQRGTRTFQVLPGGDTDWRMASQLGLHAKVKFPLGRPTPIQWHGFSALQVELEYRPGAQKDTAYAFFDAHTRLPLGTSDRTSRGFYDLVCTDLKLNPKIDTAIFSFVPPKGWKQVKN